MPYIPHTPEEQRAMLETIGVSSVEELFADIPRSLRPKSFNLPEGLSEMAVRARLEQLALKNDATLTSFLGAGFYNHYIPSAVQALISRGEFYTAYTPYQPEASQGTLQAIYEYQTAVCRLMDMEYANASMYDGGTAIYEAMMMAVRKTDRTKIVVSESLNPIYRCMLDCYTSSLNLERITVAHDNGATDVQALLDAVDDQTAAVIVQNPDFFGNINDYSALFARAREKKVVSIISAYPVLQSILKTPGEMKADIAVAEGQSLGLPLSFGGPYLGIMTCRKELIRQMPGRIVGKTVDSRGRTGYVLTLQAREQHIRRQKATSNICSNQALCALQSLVYLCLLGPEGLSRTAGICLERARYAMERLTSIPGVELVNRGPVGNEFAVRLPVNAYEIIHKLNNRDCVPGFPLGRYYPGMENCLLVACTETNTEEQIGVMAEMLKGALHP
ncbi:MAG: aminomethyl-transferring glycine dehydrogenase subunit GcvPA [Desulfovibrionales bacterium]